MRHLTPDMLPERIKARDDCIVVHSFPDEWTQDEVAQHRFDECPCAPVMNQLLGQAGYRWVVRHRWIPKTETIPL